MTRKVNLRDKEQIRTNRCKYFRDGYCAFVCIECKQECCWIPFFEKCPDYKRQE